MSTYAYHYHTSTHSSVTWKPLRLHYHEEHVNSFITVRSEEQGCYPRGTQAGAEATILHGSVLLEHHALLLEICCDFVTQQEGDLTPV